MKEMFGLVEFLFIKAKMLKLQFHGTGDACKYVQEKSDQIRKIGHAFHATKALHFIRLDDFQPLAEKQRNWETYTGRLWLGEV